MAATGYVSTTGDARKVSKAGDTMTGELVLPDSSPDTALAAASKGYADTAAAGAQSAAATDATTKVAAHTVASDPHGDRAHAASQFATITVINTLTGTVTTLQGTVTALDGFVDDALTRIAAVEDGTATLDALNVAGNALVSNGDLTVRDLDKGYRFRRGGGALDLEATGADLIVSNWSGSGFDGTQRSYDRYSADALNVQHAGKREYVNALYGDVIHTIDPTTGVAALGAKNGLANIRFCGRRATTGAPAAGDWTAGDAVQDSVGTWWLCTTGGTPGTWTTPPATPTAHASTHSSGGSDPVTVAQSQVTGLAAALAALLPLAGGTMTGTVTNNVGAAGTTAFGGGVTGDTFDRWRVLAGGTFEVGPGNAARDTNWRRSAANEWTTDDSVIVSLMLRHLGTTLGFYGATATTKPSVTGSRGGNAALASLLTALATLGLITDGTSA
ncbi:hypothetical protein PV728_47415 [Streptomyces europaeiscabiei]|uniref:hypothetical protein n=1 Tax=Streptomyces europaeiscabiei TaxID=146819 RepID=UPI0029B3B616|nr:hypothetical protein [Streptomyces europaeiscabiei]MDX3637679.1 hypothetical protein [Streptomyces europaeiscabiei]MDX3655510.1 hypothetical protein [Streptomyces europaeiscabiei]